MQPTKRAINVFALQPTDRKLEVNKAAARQERIRGGLQNEKQGGSSNKRLEPCLQCVLANWKTVCVTQTTDAHACFILQENALGSSPTLLGGTLKPNHRNVQKCTETPEPRLCVKKDSFLSILTPLVSMLPHPAPASTSRNARAESWPANKKPAHESSRPCWSSTTGLRDVSSPTSPSSLALALPPLSVASGRSTFLPAAAVMSCPEKCVPSHNAFQEDMASLTLRAGRAGTVKRFGTRKYCKVLRIVLRAYLLKHLVYLHGKALASLLVRGPFLNARSWTWLA
eukprot:1140115-Pelagomonas_calceolata.AAC.12